MSCVSTNSNNNREADWLNPAHMHMSLWTLPGDVIAVATRGVRVRRRQDVGRPFEKNIGTQNDLGTEVGIAHLGLNPRMWLEPNPESCQQVRARRDAFDFLSESRSPIIGQTPRLIVFCLLGSSQRGTHIWGDPNRFTIHWTFLFLRRPNLRLCFFLPLWL
jgi:hypothetical protein